jgi:hypothetical protein
MNTDPIVLRKPRWDCRHQADQEALEQWTDEQLDLIADRPPEALVEHDAKMYHALQALLSDQNLFRRQIERVRDFALWRHKRGRGRRKGEQRSDDWSDAELDAVPYAAEDVTRIRLIWKCEFGKQNRGDADPPTAIGIAARRHGLTEERLRLMLKNRNRRYRGIGI